MIIYIYSNLFCINLFNRTLGYLLLNRHPLCNGSRSVVPTGQPVEQPDSPLCNRHPVIQRVKLGIRTEHIYIYIYIYIYSVFLKVH